MPIRDPQHDQTQLTGTPGVMVVAAVVAAVGLIALTSVTRMLGAPAIPIWGFAGVAAVLIFRGPVGQAIARAIDRGGAAPPAGLPDEVYAELDELRARVGELEERVDFSERLLAQGKSGANATMHNDPTGGT